MQKLVDLRDVMQNPVKPKNITPKIQGSLNQIAMDRLYRIGQLLALKIPTKPIDIID
jgi:hypothetical protein